MTLRTGITTGTCAAAAAMAATATLLGQPAPEAVAIELPGGETLNVPLLFARAEDGRATAAVRKDAGDDPDVTDGLSVVATVSWATDGDVTFAAGEGVGTATKPGLQVPPGEPAINPVPREMIRAAVRAVTDRPVRVEVSIPGGREVAAKTFNPRLGIVGGLSILGTTGIVRPYCVAAQRAALRCELDVASACGVTAPVLVPGNIGAKAASARFSLRDEQLIEVGNEWGFVVDSLADFEFAAVLVAGHPGKLAKLAGGDWDTHSSRSASPTRAVAAVFANVFGRAMRPADTVEGVFASLPPDDSRKLGDALASRIAAALAARIAKATAATASRAEVSRAVLGPGSNSDRTNPAFAVYLVNMAGECLGSHGDLSPWT